MHGICELCGSYGELVQSHIIPRSFYKDPFSNIKENINRIYSNKSERYHKSPNGVYDRIVCLECEKKFQIYDDAAHKIFYQLKQSEFTYNCPGLYGSYTIIETSKIDLIKLFFISVLWRASVSTRKEFNNVNLGSKYEGMAKRAILNQDPSLCVDIDIVISKLDGDSVPFLFPFKQKFKGVKGYQLCFPFYSCAIKVGKFPFPKEINDLSINNLNKILILHRGFLGSPERKAMLEFMKKYNLKEAVKNNEHL